MTPSLIKAIDRLTVAQQDAFGAAGKLLRPGLPPSKSNPVGMSGLPGAKAYPPSPDFGGEDDKSQKWDSFWREVREKAALAQ